MQPITKLDIKDSATLVNEFVKREYTYSEELYKQSPYRYYGKEGEGIIILDTIKQEILYNVAGITYLEIKKRLPEIIDYINSNLKRMNGTLFVLNTNPLEFVWDIDNKCEMTLFNTYPITGLKFTLLYGTDRRLYSSSNYSGIHVALWGTKYSSNLIKQDGISTNARCYLEIFTTYFASKISDLNKDRIVLKPDRKAPNDDLLKTLRSIKYKQKEKNKQKKDDTIYLSTIITFGVPPIVDKRTIIELDRDIEQLTGVKIYSIILDEKGVYYITVNKIPENDALFNLLGSHTIIYTVVSN